MRFVYLLVLSKGVCTGVMGTTRFVGIYRQVVDINSNLPTTFGSSFYPPFPVAGFPFRYIEASRELIRHGDRSSTLVSETTCTMNAHSRDILHSTQISKSRPVRQNIQPSEHLATSWTRSSPGDKPDEHL